MNKISCAVLMGILFSPQISLAEPNGFVDVRDSSSYEYIKLENEIAALMKKRDEVHQSVQDVETTYKDQLTNVEAEPEKDAVADEKDAADEAEDKLSDKVSKDGKAPTPSTLSDKAIDKATEKTVPTPKAKIVPEEISLPKPQPKRYSPEKAQPDNSRGRRPFIRSELKDGQKIHFAGIFGSDTVGFGDETTTEEDDGVYSGYNDNNIYVFPDAYANFCRLNANDAAKDGKMEECLKSILVDMANPNQEAKNETRKMFNDGLIQEVTQGVVVGLQSKNVAANFETDVLDPLKEKTAKSTTERGDFQSITLTDMEAIKTKYRIIEVYSMLLKFQALKNFGDFEVKSTALTNIKETEESDSESKS